jgi:hypothetical protein
MEPKTKRPPESGLPVAYRTKIQATFTLARRSDQSPTNILCVTASSEKSKGMPLERNRTDVAQTTRKGASPVPFYSQKSNIKSKTQAPSPRYKPSWMIPMDKELKTAEQLRDLLTAMLGVRDVDIQVRKDHAYGWQPVVVSSPGDLIGYQRRVEEIASRLRVQYALRD